MIDLALTDDESRQIEAFVSEHRKCVRHTTFGDDWTLHITPTGIGNTIIVECNYCKADILIDSNW